MRRPAQPIRASDYARQKPIWLSHSRTQIRTRQSADGKLRVDSFHSTKLRGHVDSLSPASGLEFALLPPDNATGNFTKIVQRVPVKIVLDDASLKGLLRPGMSAVPTVDTKSALPLRVRPGSRSLQARVRPRAKRRAIPSRASLSPAGQSFQSFPDYRS
jgi:multidrug resistance efflux pump